MDVTPPSQSPQVGSPDLDPVSDPAVTPPPPAEAPLAFEEVYAAQLDYVWHTLRRLGARPADLEDLCQEVFVTFFRTLPAYDRARPLRPWLFGIAFRILSDHRRRASTQREVPVELGDTAADPTIHPEAEAEGAERRRLVLAALDGLELKDRAVLVLCDLEERPAPEAAELLGIPLNTVYSRLRAARERFAAAVRRRLR